MHIDIPSPVLHAIHRLNDAGYEAYIVGGCVRDSLMGNIPADWDITTSALPEQTSEVFANFHTIDTGVQHGTVTVIIENMPLEITTFRVDGTYSDGRHPDEVTFTPSLEEDLRRRDFTVNAMAYHPKHGIVDCFGGQEDIQNQIIRCVGNPEERFNEDALRILRAIRFAAVLNFSIESATANAIHRLSANLQNVSIERITAEFKRLICANDVVLIMDEFRDVMGVFMPEITSCDDFSLLSRVPEKIHVRLAALFNSAAIDTDAAVGILKRMRFDRQTMKDVSLLLSFRIKDQLTEKQYFLRLLNHLGSELIFDYLAMKEADPHTVLHAKKLLMEDPCYKVSMLAINGDDLLLLGIPAGPEIGFAMNELLNAVINGDCSNEKDALLSYWTTMKKPVQ